VTARIRVFEGVPPKYADASRLVVPRALRVVMISYERPVTPLGALATTFGWKYAPVVEPLEEIAIFTNALTPKGSFYFLRRFDNSYDFILKNDYLCKICLFMR
jgi:hypothetical protein